MEKFYRQTYLLLSWNSPDNYWESAPAVDILLPTYAERTKSFAGNMRPPPALLSPPKNGDGILLTSIFSYFIIHLVSILGDF